MKTDGKTFTLLVINFVILSICLSGIIWFFWFKEIELRKETQARLDEVLIAKVKMSDELKESKKRIFLLEEKNKEADDRINSLLDDLELEQGLRDEIKTENKNLEESLEQERQAKERLRQELTDELEKSLEAKIALEAQLRGLQSTQEALAQRHQELEEERNTLKEMVDELKVSLKAASLPTSEASEGETAIPAEFELDKIVVTALDVPRGRVISIDQEVEFVIFDLGLRDQIVEGDIFAVYRGNEYLGDIRVTRVQEEMSAADFIPPFSSRKVRKNDLVVLKK